MWSNYPKELHPWLLRLTEEFDLTCPLPDKDITIVPCLLPDTEPKVCMGGTMRKRHFGHADSEGPDQPAHLCSLIRALTVL